uniref:Uncharacterized protein n=1 Tax=Chromera velia CCMP2878 TaxID=1169474 RepID=A0A0G4F3G6_9ALVE|eukprot:Cvel_14901.t1-p1 / transcript=Cvel_14901.t1 / gene=Cvel_14901 / organism=Chromera_velia_CCMP2878 / gene_product=Putative ankyrin repeat protein RF_0381, putative / transcript_product=Putative ankyrin repeat protein RF_0381, putative / location=Cvel_scaffold1079:53215-54825(-) / protein_length=537 / sequence_SO=supercontig / SO=protein_coding / is_pseudo=false
MEKQTERVEDALVAVASDMGEKRRLLSAIKSQVRHSSSSLRAHSAEETAAFEQIRELVDGPDGLRRAVCVKLSEILGWQLKADFVRLLEQAAVRLRRLFFRSTIEAEIERLEGILRDVAEEIHRKRKSGKETINSHSAFRVDLFPSACLPSGVTREAAARALCRLRELVERVHKRVSKRLDKLISFNFQVDLTIFRTFLKRQIGTVLRSFRAVSAETLCKALIVFLTSGDPDDFLFLLFVGSDMDGVVHGRTALGAAAESGHLVAVWLLLRAGADIDVKDATRETALHRACRAHKVDVAKFLLVWGADPNLTGRYGKTLLHIASTHGLVDLMSALLKKGAEVGARSATGRTALHEAAACGQREAVELLLDRGAEANGVGQPAFCALLFTLSPRFLALTDYRDIAAILIARGADVNAVSNHGTPILLEASFWGSADVAELLVEAGADVNSTAVNGWTALHCVAEFRPQTALFRVDPHKQLRIAQMLVSHGINVHAVDNNGLTALALAKRKRIPDSPIRLFLEGLPQPQAQPQQQQQQP